MQLRVRLRQFLDKPDACRFGGRVGNTGVTRGEELLLLELQPLPWRVRENDIEAAIDEDFGEFHRPVEETLAHRQHPCLRE